jgi:D-alanyl-D-alanine carboxypeptidase/D-alanyl-D-alanine-endopeptidase (penicillin-binding protein 4)
MTQRFSRRAFLAALSTSIATGALADPPTKSLRPRLRGEGFAKRAVPGPEAIFKDANLSGKVTYAVASVETGEILESRDAATAAPPASVAKAVTALYALHELGADHRFRTSVVATGGLENGVVQGDLVLAGGGDPSLDSNHLADLAAQIKDAGIREVRGRFLVWDGALPREDRIDPAQPDHVGYNPAVSGLALNYNRVHFGWQRGSNGYRVTMDARTDKYRPDVTVAHMQVVSRDMPVYTYTSTPVRDEWTVARGALGNGGARWLPVRLPGLYAGDVFRTMARSHGLVLPAPELVDYLPEGETEAIVNSAPLRVILQDMLKYSNNLIAEMVGLASTARRLGRATSLKESAAEMSRWAGAELGMTETRLVDHSGLGDASRMRSDEMAQALVKAHARGFGKMLKSIPMRDGRGRPVSSHPITVHAKTGTLNFVSGLAGYITPPNGAELAFAVFAADIETRLQITRADRERPRGARGWNMRAKRLQQDLIERWAALYS